MVYSVKHICLDHGIMNHIFEHNPFSDLQFMIEAPPSHIVTTQTGVSSQTINELTFVPHFRTTNSRLIRHFQTVGHVTSETDVQNGCLDAAAFNDIDYCMKVRAQDKLVVYNPYALLYHYESKSRGLEDTPEKIARFNREIKIFSEKWPDILKNGDPYYNPNLTLRKSNFALRDLKKEKIGEPYPLEI